MRIGYHAVYDTSFEDAVCFAADNGFDYVQFDLNVPRFYLENLSDKMITRLKSVLVESGVGISFHAPGDYVGLFLDYPGIREGMLSHFKTIIGIANELGAMHMTFHPLAPPSFRKSETGKNDFEAEYSSYFGSILKENLLEIERVSGNLKICIENYKLGNIARNVLRELFKEDANLHLTLDIPKLYSGKKPDLQLLGFYDEYIDKIAEIHLHDMIYGEQSHLLLGKGEINFNDYFPKFLKGDSTITIEIRPRELALQAKKIFIRDFIDNEA